MGWQKRVVVLRILCHEFHRARKGSVVRGDKDDCQNYRPFPINNKVTTTLLKRDVSDFQLSDKALDLVKDPNGGNVTIPPLEGQLTRGTSGRGRGTAHAHPRRRKVWCIISG